MLTKFKKNKKNKTSKYLDIISLPCIKKNHSKHIRSCTFVFMELTYSFKNRFYTKMCV